MKFSDENEQKKALEEFQNASGLGGKPIRISIAVNKGYLSFEFYFCHCYLSFMWSVRLSPDN